MKRNQNGHGLTAFRVVGGLLPPEFLQSIAALQAKHQTGADYGLSKSLVLKDEIARDWRIANDLYAAYVERRARVNLDAENTGVQEWLFPLFRDVFGFREIAPTMAIIIGDRWFPITHSAFDGAVPMLFTVHDVNLDRADTRFDREGRRRAAYGVMQEFLNASDCALWGVASNGVALRLLRDNPSLTRPAYIEADLQRIFEEQLYSDFALLWLTLHASRLRPMDGKASGCILEAWRSQAQETGLRALEHLREGVTAALRTLGNGFLQHPENERLRDGLASGALSTDAYFQELLQLVYRLLFLFTAEERHLLHGAQATGEQLAIYRDGYAIARLRERALRRRHYDRHVDLWRGLLILFRALDKGAPAIDLPALGGLFAADKCIDLDAGVISNEPLLESVRALTFFRSGSSLARVNYRDMGTEELGSVYESLLELHPFLDVNTVPWTFGFVGEDTSERAKGSARKLTGSYYTPASLVNEIIVSAVDPVLARALQARPEDQRSALLGLRVVDPACGSGHFLLAAARRIATELSRIEADSNASAEAVRQHALRAVVQHCIYGVDRNPLAVELCRTALWIETLEPGKPLTFLDPHIQCGDSLVGILDPLLLHDGIPDGAYEALGDDDKQVCRQLKRSNRSMSSAIQGRLFERESLKTIAELGTEMDLMPEETLDNIAAKRYAWESTRASEIHCRERLRADLFTAAFFMRKTSDTSSYVPLSEDLHRVERGMPIREGVEANVRDLATKHRFFHWHVSFSEIMRRGGFDIVLGNPPWERVKIQEQEFFAHRSPGIAAAPNKAARERMIAQLSDPGASYAERTLGEKFSSARREAEATIGFLRSSGRFSLTGAGDINTYAVFSETFLSLTAPMGRAGIIVPSGIVCNETNMAFFAFLVGNHRIESLFSFYEVRLQFRGTDDRDPFCLLTMKGKAMVGDLPAKYCFGLKSVDGIKREGATFSLMAGDLSLFSPNTETCPIFRSQADVLLTRDIYDSSPVLINRKAGNDPWGADEGKRRAPCTMFHMAGASGLFQTASWLEERGGVLVANRYELDRELWLPLYESKMLYQYDHRYGTFAGISQRRNAMALKRPAANEVSDPCWLPMPWYWLKSEHVDKVMNRWPRNWLLAFRDLSKTANERTTIFSVLPRVAVADTARLLLTEEAGSSAALAACLLANFNSLVFDYCSRQKVSGAHVSFYFLEQLPTLPPSRYTDGVARYIVPRALELTVTSWDVKPFLDDVWREGDKEMRAAVDGMWHENALATGGHSTSQPWWYEAPGDGFPRPPFRSDESRRARLRAELDAIYAKLYGLGRGQVQYILDPTSVYGPDYPSETFRVLKQRETEEFGEYRTARLVLEAWDREEHGAYLVS